jgi:hypothetical protein
MQGLHVFSSLEEAVRAGFRVYERTDSGYTMRVLTPSGWALAIVKKKGG